MDVEKATFDTAARAVITGRAGLFLGEQAFIHLGQCIVVGRSRTCDVSVARAGECLKLSKEALEHHASYRKISRRHFRVCLVSPEVLEVEDLSTNGTVVNGHRVHRVQIPTFGTEIKEVVIEFGEGENMLVEAASVRAVAPSERRTELHDLGPIRRPSPLADIEETPVP